MIPYPYRFHWDGVWVCVLVLFVAGFIWPALHLIAIFIAFMRALVWCSFRFPLTTIFFSALISGLFSGRR